MLSTSTAPETFKKAWHEFISTGNVKSTDVRPVILASWKRCRNMGVDPYQTVVPEVLTFNQLEERRRINHELISVALPIMEKLYKFVSGSGFIVSLADKEGYLLEIIGDQEVAQSAQKGNFISGANWSELSAGTNAVGTSIAIKKPLQVFSFEHYCMCSHKWTCSAAPIFSPINNQLTGVLNMTGRYENVHCHTLGMVFAAVHAIENELALRNAWMCCEVANEQKNKIIDSITEGIIAIDQQSRITQVNKISCQLIGFSETRVLYQDICNVLGPYNKPLLQIFTQNNEVTDLPVTIYNLLSQNKYQCTVTLRLIKAENGEHQGKVVLLSEIKRARNLVKQMLGNQARFTFNDLIGNNQKFLRTIELAKSAAESNSNVLLLGESGTGKEMFAQAIHNASSRKDGPFLALNCSGIPRDLMASELFGYVEGAFTGAKRGGNPGKFELADGGTLFLDEIGDMPLELQSILLRVLEEKQIMRIGSSEYIPVDVRIISATNKNLWQEVKNGNFRDDLFYRLNILTINMVPLRERKEDIVILTRYFLDKFSRQQNKTIDHISPEVLDLFTSYSWPGNVRQLQNIVERIVNTIKCNTLTIDLIPEEIRKKAFKSATNSQQLKTLERNEKELITELMEKHNNNISRVARELNVARTTLYRKLRKYGLG